jgi:hypothetical protein
VLSCDLDETKEATMPDIARIQAEVKAAGADGWLLYDFHNRDAIAYHVLGMDYGKFTSRRWFYWIPAAGEPIRLCHKVEAKKLESLPGEKRLYLSWKELHASLKEMLGPAKKIAMQYSPTANIPYVSLVDGGTIDLIRSLGYEVVSSAGLVQTFQAVLDEAGYRSHLEAGERVQRIKDEAFALIGIQRLSVAGRQLGPADDQHGRRDAQHHEGAGRARDQGGCGHALDAVYGFYGRASATIRRDPGIHAEGVQPRGCAQRRFHRHVPARHPDLGQRRLECAAILLLPLLRTMGSG